jgi:hypothetical protein
MYDRVNLEAILFNKTWTIIDPGARVIFSGASSVTEQI